MPLILAVDTTSEHGSIALARDGEVVEEVALHSTTGFSQILYGEIERLLARHGVKVNQIDCFAAASGPGSFTGVRVGLACVKGLADALGRKAIAVSNLEAVARCGKTPVCVPVIDARRGEVYTAVYDEQGRLISPEVVTKQVPEGPEVVHAPTTLAAVIAAIAAEREGSDPAALDANYVRRSDAELFWKD